VLLSLKYRLFFSLIFIFLHTFSQNSNYSYGVKTTIHYGSILPHRPIVNEIIKGHSLITELSFFRLTNGKKQWQQLYHYPKIGVSALFLSLGNPQQLGNGYGIFPFIVIPLTHSKIQWNLKMGYGLGYVTKPFNRETNFKNIVLGSRFNALIHVNSFWSVYLTKQLKTDVGLSLTHLSNGSFRRPNLGINIVSVNGGLSYVFGKQQEKIVSKIIAKPKKWNKFLVGNVGLKEIPPVDGPKYFVSTASFNLIKSFSAKSSYGFAADFFYNSSISPTLKNNTGKKLNNADNFRLGIAAIYEIDFGRISYLFQMGVYLRTANISEGYIYHRITSRYYVNDRLFINLGLKTHYAVAEFVELGIGYKL